MCIRDSFHIDQLTDAIDWTGADAIVLSHGDMKISEDKLARLSRLNSENLPIFIGSFAGPIGANSESGPIEPPHIFKSGPIEPANLSGPIEPLNRLEEKIVNKYNDLCDSNPVLIDRHVTLIREISKKSLRLQGLVGEFVDAGVLAHETQSLETELSELVGIVTSREVLDNIFTNFCIGK